MNAEERDSLGVSGIQVLSISVQLKNKKITDKQCQALTKLLDSIDENDNNYIIYGKLKK